MKRALITGITGQDGAYLARLLLSEGYTVFGGYRRASSVNLWRLNELDIEYDSRLKLIALDVTDPESCRVVIEAAQPDEIYNLAAQSFVGASFTAPKATSEITGLGVLNMLEATRHGAKGARFYQASSSEMFGRVHEVPQRETTALHPRSPYGVAKVYGHLMAQLYREAYGMFVCSGILFNHESPLRGPEFVTRKITMSLAQQKLNNGPAVSLGNLDAKRDWGHAEDYVRAMYLMLQHSVPDDYVVASGMQSSVRDFLLMAAECAGFTQLDYRGSGTNENLYAGDRVIARIDPQFYRPAEVDTLLGDAQKIHELLGWAPLFSFDGLVRDMVMRDIDRLVPF